MKLILILATLLSVALTANAQCSRTCQVTFTNAQTGKPYGGVVNVELKTGYTLWEETGNTIYKDHEGRIIFAVMTRPGKRESIVVKVKIGAGSELIWCGASPCQVNCDLFDGTYSVIDFQGNKGVVKPLTYQ